jgi:hypothetical protein
LGAAAIFDCPVGRTGIARGIALGIAFLISGCAGIAFAVLSAPEFALLAFVRCTLYATIKPPIAPTATSGILNIIVR